MQMEIPLIGNRTGVTREYCCAVVGGTLCNTLLIVTTVMLATPLIADDYCEHHRAAWIFTCLSIAATGAFAYQRFKDRLGNAASPHTCINTTSLMINSAITIVSIGLSIFGEACK